MRKVYCPVNSERIDKIRKVYCPVNSRYCSYRQKDGSCTILWDGDDEYYEDEEM